MSSKWWSLFPAGAGVLVAVAVALSLASTRHRILQTNAVALAGSVAVLRGGDSACQTGVAPVAPFRRVQVWGVGVGQGPPLFELTVTSHGRTVAIGRGRSSMGVVQPLRVRLDRTVGAKSVVAVCVRNTSRVASQELHLSGSEAGGAGPTASITPVLQRLQTSDGAANDLRDMRVDMLREESRTGLALLPAAFRRVADGRPGGIWAPWIAAGVMFILVPSVLAGVIRSASSGDESVD